MDDVASVQLENENLRKIRSRLLQWETKSNALAALNVVQEECLEQINLVWSQEVDVKFICRFVVWDIASYLFV